MRDGWIYARGVADDKGQLYLQLKAAALLAAEGSLPVNVRFTCDGEEESGGHSIVDFLEADERGGDACIIFDGHMPAPGQPAFCVRRAASATSTSASRPASVTCTRGSSVERR